MKEPKNIFAENLKYYMDMHDITQKELSEIVGVSAPTVHDWVKGKKYPRMDKIERIANYFGIQKSDLIEDTHPNNGSYIEIKPNYKAARNLTYDVADELEKIINDIDHSWITFNGKGLNEELREVLKASLKNSLVIAKITEKNKDNSKKYRKKQGANNGNSNKTE